jgi:hypothetical protein
MVVCVYTSITGAYLPNARILAKSLAEVQPDWIFVLLFNDFTPPQIDWSREIFDHIYFGHWLPINNFKRWAFDHNVVEFCTATKGIMAQHLFKRFQADVVIYLDPDVLVFSPLEEILELIQHHSVILTPHLTDPETDNPGVESHEMAALKHGTFNLGFFAIANNRLGHEYLAWWANRARDYSYVDFERGTFTDQKWANLAPYMFDGIYVLRDKAYNVATWNMKNRLVRKDQAGVWKVNGERLRFYHFSGFGHDFAWADRELAMFDEQNSDLRTLWDLYKKLYHANSVRNVKPWRWGHFANGLAITPGDRKRYREDPELMSKFPDPYSVECFKALREHS